MFFIRVDLCPVQDRLALQLIAFMRDILNAEGLPLFLRPYEVVATGPNAGIIECVPRTVSRDQLGKTMEGDLYSHFRSK